MLGASNNSKKPCWKFSGPIQTKLLVYITLKRRGRGELHPETEQVKLCTVCVGAKGYASKRSTGKLGVHSWKTMSSIIDRPRAARSAIQAMVGFIAAWANAL